MRPAVDYLYSLYDALISIHVPNDKARAVIDAMERDMGSTLATKVDLQLLEQKLSFQINAGVVDLRQEIALVRKDMEAMSTSFHKDLELLATGMTVRLGSMLIVGLGVLFAALKLT